LTPDLSREDDRALSAAEVAGKGTRAAKGTSEGVVAHADDADVVGATQLPRALGALLGHLDLDGVLDERGDGQAGNAKAGGVLDDLGSLEGLGVLAAGRAVDGSRQGAGAVLVHLRERG